MTGSSSPRSSLSPQGATEPHSSAKAPSDAVRNQGVGLDAGPQAGYPSRGALWTGRVLSGLGIAFLAADAVGKFARPEEVISGTTALGYSADVLVPLGIILSACLVLHVIPRTATLGAILITGFLGGAVATHVRVDNPLFSHVLFPFYVAAFIWGGLWLREPRLRALVPFATRASRTRTGEK